LEAEVEVEVEPTRKWHQRPSGGANGNNAEAKCGRKPDRQKTLT